MNLSNLPTITRRTKKRVGRGIGSGKGGHTSGRGQKGQKSRRSIPLHFMGAATGSSLIKQLPYLRGKGKMKTSHARLIPLNVEALNILKKDTTVTIETLVKAQLVDAKNATLRGVKILGSGKLSVALTVLLPVSKGARSKIEKAGGTVEEKISKEPKSKKSKDQVSK